MRTQTKHYKETQSQCRMSPLSFAQTFIYVDEGILQNSKRETRAAIVSLEVATYTIVQQWLDWLRRDLQKSKGGAKTYCIVQVITEKWTGMMMLPKKCLSSLKLKDFAVPVCGPRSVVLLRAMYST